MSYNAKIRADAMSLNPIDDALFIKMAESLKVCQEMLRVFLMDKQLVVAPEYCQKSAGTFLHP